MFVDTTGGNGELGNVLKLMHILGLLRVASFRKKSTTLLHMKAKGISDSRGRLTIPLAMIGTAFEYLVAVPFDEADAEFKFLYL